MRKYQFLPKMTHLKISYILHNKCIDEKCGCLSWPNMIIIVWKSLFCLSYIIYKKLMPPTTTVRVGVGGKIMAAVFYVLWAIKKGWCITVCLSLITLHVYTLCSPINSALFFFILLCFKRQKCVINSVDQNFVSHHSCSWAQQATKSGESLPI